MYCWADGIHVTVRLDGAKLCLLVLVGVRADGRKELITLADGHRESTESWADLLRDVRHGAAGERRDPVLAAFAVAGDVRARPEVHVGSGEPDEFGDPQSGLDGEQQQRVVAPPGPGRPVAAEGVVEAIRLHNPGVHAEI